MEKDREDGDDLPTEINRIKDQIEKERTRHIHQMFELKCKPSVATGSSHHETLAYVRSGEEDNNGRGNNKLLSRMQTQVHCFSNEFIYESDEDYDILDDETDDESISPTIKLPFVEQLPKSTTWVLADSNQLMGEGESVIHKIQYYYEDDEATELSSENEDDEEEIERIKHQFSESEDRFIWKVGQKHGLNDVVTQTVLTKFLKADLSDILERFNDLKLKNEESVGQASDSRSKSIITTFQATANRNYCRRCLKFNCNTHEKSQPEIKPRDKDDDELYFSEDNDDRNQCSEHCYLKAKSVTESDHVVNNIDISNTKGKNVVSDTVTEDYAVIDVDAEMTIWTPEEKELYLRALEIYGRNSCLIAKNAFWELKTCLEVYNYMLEQDQRTTLFGCNLAIKPKPDDQVIKRKIELRKRLHLHKNMRLRKLARRRPHPRALRKAANTEQRSYKLYKPCTCDSICGDQCPCYANANCCEKYCGCWKDCKNRYGGCTCVRGQCVNRHCLCFTANRECDPDLCQNCCLSYGDNSVDETSEQIKCNNMQSLIKKHKKVLIAKSDIHGWGAFTRYSLKKNEYIGEYTGELITHSEADQRGIVEEHFGTSYLFTLNDQFEIDARRKGNKLKFINHSAKPNCYAKLMIVRGDHRIGFFAMKDIEEGEELCFDYNYKPEQAQWYRGRNFRKSTASSS